MTSTFRRIGRRRKRLAALALSYLIVELVFMPTLAWFAPLSVRARLPAPLYILGQHSKSGLLPRDYVLVLGDSYAEGQGDWLTQALEEGGNRPFQATDVLHELTGRDVITFGRGGADNVASAAYLVQKRFAALRRTGLAEPTEVLIYFYEGNDLSDNLRQARKHFGLGERSPDGFEDRELAAGVEARANIGFRKGLLGMFYAPYVLLNLINGGSAGGKSHEGPSSILALPPLANLAGETNVIDVDGSHLQFVGTAQGPVLELEEDELNLALRILEHTLSWAKMRFEGARCHLVYIPSPLACYRLLSAEVAAQVPDRTNKRVPSTAVQLRSKDLRARVRHIASEVGIGFIDATPVLKRAARKQLIHGPMDAKHLNRIGYETLAGLLARELTEVHPISARR